MRRLVLAAVSSLIVLASMPLAVASPERSAALGHASLGHASLGHAFPGVGGISHVRQIDLTGTVDPFLAREVKRGLLQAQRDSARAVIIRIDTPGGLSSSMRDIVQAIDASSVPVVCWVGPVGARAASAGAIVLLGCPIAAMATGTNVGAAHPVGITGGIMSEKVTNDAAAYARALAQRWNRNAAWAESAVRDSVSVSAPDALKIHVIDFIASSRSELLTGLNGRTAVTSSGSVELAHLSNARIEIVQPTLAERIFHGLIDPNLAFLFFMVGIAALVFEVLHPGLSVPAIVGIILLVASLIMFGMLPVNIGGLVLLIVAMVAFVVDIHRPSHGVGTGIAVITTILGGLFLFDSSVPSARVSRWLIAVTTFGMAAFFGLVVKAVVAARKLPARAAGGAEPGSRGVAIGDLAPGGVIRVAGEQWSALSDTGRIQAGSGVRVVAREGLTLHVVEDQIQGE